MQHRQAQGRSEAGPAARGPGRGGKPAETGGGTTGVESQLVELRTRVGGLETVSERAEDRWEKSRTDQEETKQEIVVIKREIVEVKREIVEVRQEQKEMKGEMAEMKQEIAGVKQEQKEMKGEVAELRKEQTELRKETMAGFQRVEEKLDEKLEMVRRESSMQIIQFMQSIDRRMNRLDVAHLLMLAAILGAYFFD